jgi:hypothetical protein
MQQGQLRVLGRGVGGSLDKLPQTFFEERLENLSLGQKKQKQGQDQGKKNAEEGQRAILPGKKTAGFERAAQRIGRKKRICLHASDPYAEIEDTDRGPARFRWAKGCGAAEEEEGVPGPATSVSGIAKQVDRGVAKQVLLQGAMKSLWTAQVHILTPPSPAGNTRCCTNVVAWAEDPAEYQAAISTVLSRRYWSILSIQRCERVANCLVISDELIRQVERAESRPGSCIYGTLHYYPSKPC